MMNIKNGDKKGVWVLKSETPCNCALDSVDTMTGFELPKVELLQSKTEIPLEWTELKKLAWMVSL